MQPKLSEVLRHYPWVDVCTEKRIQGVLSLLDKWNNVYNLTGLDRDLWWDSIVNESLALVNLLPVSVRTASPQLPWMDMGTGAGIPGLIIAAALPTQSIVLVDSRQKKIDFIREACRRSDLDAVIPLCHRLETLPSVRPELIRGVSVFFSRALASPDQLLRYAGPMAVSGAWLISPRAGTAHGKGIQLRMAERSDGTGECVQITLPISARGLKCLAVRLEA
ncbi:class I SAM-dependent methyltransferase [bacterium]|nr:class I SAM-dependent methyltransferase [candidate division CSSED10-310 bacterium]